MKYRKGQRICRVEWSDGEPFIRVAVVTKTGPRTYYIAGEKKSAKGWFTNWQDAIEAEYRDIIRHAAPRYDRRPPGISPWAASRYFAKVRRLVGRIKKRKARK